MQTKDKIFLGIGTVAIVAALGVGVFAITKDLTSSSESSSSTVATTSTSSDSSDTSNSSSTTSSESSSTDTAAETTTTTTSTAASDETSGYIDGTYTASASYSVPHGYSNEIAVTVVVSGGVITSVSTDNTYTDHESGEYIDSFESSLNSKVVGKSLDSTSYSRIGGASLTTDGFVAALEKIQSEAAA